MKDKKLRRAYLELEERVQELELLVRGEAMCRFCDKALHARRTGTGENGNPHRLIWLHDDGTQVCPRRDDGKLPARPRTTRVYEP